MMDVFREAEEKFGSQRAVAREIGRVIGVEIPARTYRDWATRAPRYKSTDALVRYVLKTILSGNGHCGGACDCCGGRNGE